MSRVFTTRSGISKLFILLNQTVQTTKCFIERLESGEKQATLSETLKTAIANLCRLLQSLKSTVIL